MDRPLAVSKSCCTVRSLYNPLGIFRPRNADISSWPTVQMFLLMSDWFIPCGVKSNIFFFKLLSCSLCDFRYHFISYEQFERICLVRDVPGVTANPSTVRQEVDAVRSASVRREIGGPRCRDHLASALSVIQGSRRWAVGLRRSFFPAFGDILSSHGPLRGARRHTATHLVPRLVPHRLHRRRITMITMLRPLGIDGGPVSASSHRRTPHW